MTDVNTKEQGSSKLPGWHVHFFYTVVHSSFCISENLNVFSPAGSSSPADMECGGGELSDSGSSGYWSWDHGNVSPAPSPCVTEVDSSPDEGLHMELDQGEELNAKKPTVPRYVPLNYLLFIFHPSFPPVFHLCRVFLLTELPQGGVQMSLAQLRQGANFFSRNKETYPCAPSGVSWICVLLKMCRFWWYRDQTVVT